MATKTDNTKVVTSLPALSRDGANAIGAAVDWSGYGLVEAVCDLGDVAAGGNADFYLQQSDHAAFDVPADIDDLDEIEDILPAAKNTAVILEAKRSASSKKYVRAKHTSTGVVVAGVVLVLREPREAPIA